MSWSKCMPLYRLLLGAMSITAYGKGCKSFTIGDSTYTINTRVFGGFSVLDEDGSELSVGDLITSDNVKTVVELLCNSDWCFIPMPRSFVNMIRPSMQRNIYLPYVGASLYQLSNGQYVYFNCTWMVEPVFCMCHKDLLEALFPFEAQFNQNAYCIKIVDNVLTVKGSVGRDACNLILPEDCRVYTDKVIKELSSVWKIDCKKDPAESLPLLLGLLDGVSESNKQRLLKAMEAIDKNLPDNIESVLSYL